MTAAVRDMAMVPAEESAPGALGSLIERLAANPMVDVGKLEKFIELQERMMRHNAEAAFNAAFLQMQCEIPEIDEKGRILNNKGTVQSTYARHEDIQRVIKPILQKHGFTLSFRCEWPDASTVMVVGILSHKDGHTRESRFRTAADTSGSKNAVQGLGSGVSYGRRYTTNDLLNITTRGQDDDGVATTNAPLVDPDGFEDWAADLELIAKEQGHDTLKEAWKKSSALFRDHMSKHYRPKWEGMKATALKVKA